MGHIRKASCDILLMVCFTACSISPKTTTGENRVSTQTINDKPSITQTESLAPSITPTLTITPTIGPPPDLELTNVTIYPDTFDKAGQDYFLMGRVRNNTESIMTFSDYDLVFKFIFEIWEYNSAFFALDYVHVKYLEEVTLGIDISRKMNCILYPGDEGVFYYETISNRTDYLLDETVKEYNGPLGIWYTYESYYHTEPNLPLYYHPKTENIVFSKENGELIFDYDIVDMPNLLNPSNVSRVYSWLILYDRNGKIINILKKWLAEMPGLTYGGTFHVHSETGVSPNEMAYFHPVYKLTPEMIENVDHLEVLNEFEEMDTCRKIRT
jgi:hypothetical protein